MAPLLPPRPKRKRSLKNYSHANSYQEMDEEEGMVEIPTGSTTDTDKNSLVHEFRNEPDEIRPPARHLSSDTIASTRSTLVHYSKKNQEDDDASSNKYMKKGFDRRLKRMVLLLLLLSGIAIATTVYIIPKDNQMSICAENFKQDSSRLMNSFYQSQMDNVWALQHLGDDYLKLENSNQTNNSNSFPMMSMPNYESHVATYLRTAPSALSIFMSPLIEDQRIQLKWTKYATSHQAEACDAADGIFKESNNEAFLQEAIARSEEDRRKRIFLLETDGTLDDDWSNASKLPLWQISCPRRHTILWNVKALPELEDVLNLTTLEMGVPQISPFLPSYAVDFIHDIQKPLSFMFNPIVEGNNSILGVTGMEVDWSSMWRKVELFEGTAVRVVLRNSCQPDEARTYQIRHHELDNATVEFIGEGDLHDNSFDGIGYYSTSSDEFLNYLRSQSKFYKKDLDLVETMIDESFCDYEMSVHLTEDYVGHFRSSAPLLYLLLALGITAVVIFMFILYGKLMEQRQAEVMEKAAKSEAIVKSLFPAVVRDRLFGVEEAENRRRSPLFPSSRYHITGRSNGDHPEISVKSNLTNFLATSNRQESYPGLDEEPIAEMFSNTTIMFADIAGFTAWSSEREPAKVFKLLETLYHEFDAIAKRLDVFKVETIGDCYVAVSGLPHPQKNHAKIMARFASEILTSATNLTQELDSVLGPGTSDLGMRVGLHSGAVTAGVLRGAKSRFQLFGDTVNTASRMESTGEMGKIQVSEITANLIVQSGKKHWLKEREGTISVKGKGHMKVKIKGNY